jgi:protoporphyrinogen oxidase
MKAGQADDLGRRAFLLKLGGLMAAAYTLQLEEMAGIAKGSPLKSTPYSLAPWSGDDFTLGHRMRSGDGPRLPKVADSKVDFIIVGGGNSGLSSAYKLRDTNFLLLEQYDDLGGTSRGNAHNGLWYSIGAAYYSEEEGPVAELVDKFGLKPAVLTPEKNSFYFEEKWVSGVDGPDSNLLYRNFKRLKADIAPVMKELNYGEPGLPVDNPALLKLDKINFAEMLSGYDPEFRQFVDRILMSSACADTNKTNALAGSILANDFFDKSFVLPGGNPCLTRALAANIKGKQSATAGEKAQSKQKQVQNAAKQNGAKRSASNHNQARNDNTKHHGLIASGQNHSGYRHASPGSHQKGHGESALDERLKTGCFVWSVDIRDDGASVVYSEKSGRMHRVDCKHVIFATPPMVTGRIINGMKTEAKAPLFWFRYGSYLVANMICKKRVFKGSYDNFLRPPFEFSDIVVAETPYLKTNIYKDSMESVLTVYRPWMPGTMGRSVLQDGDRPKLAAELVKAMGEFIPDLENNIREIALTRWGHAINICQLRYYERISKINSSFGDSYTLSHSSLQGIQCIESAVLAGNLAADRALKKNANGARSGIGGK